MAHWYWHGNEGADIARGTKHAFCSHFGSMAFAGLATWFIERLKQATRTRPNHPIACLIVLIARCILSYIECECGPFGVKLALYRVLIVLMRIDLFKMAVIMVAIKGDSFGNSGVAVGRLFWKVRACLVMMYSLRAHNNPLRRVLATCTTLLVSGCSRAEFWVGSTFCSAWRWRVRMEVLRTTPHSTNATMVTSPRFWPALRTILSTTRMAIV